MGKGNFRMFFNTKNNKFSDLLIYAPMEKRKSDTYYFLFAPIKLEVAPTEESI